MMNKQMMFDQNNFNPMLFNMMLNMMNIMYPTMGYNNTNYNMNNQQNNMNLMMNWINMNPNLFLMYQMMMNNINNTIKKNKNNNNNSNRNKMNLIRVSQLDLNQAKRTGGGVISNKIPNNSTFDVSPFDQNYKVNIAFTTQKGQKINVICPVNMRMNDLFVKYITRLGLGPNVLGDSIFFLYNGSNIKINEQRTASELGLIDGSNIIVLDIKGVIGS